MWEHSWKSQQSSKDTARLRWFWMAGSGCSGRSSRLVSSPPACLSTCSNIQKPGKTAVKEIIHGAWLMGRQVFPYWQAVKQSTGNPKRSHLTVAVIPRWQNEVRVLRAVGLLQGAPEGNVVTDVFLFDLCWVKCQRFLTGEEWKRCLSAWTCFFFYFFIKYKT